MLVSTVQYSTVRANFFCYFWWKGNLYIPFS